MYMTCNLHNTTGSNKRGATLNPIRFLTLARHVNVIEFRRESKDTKLS